MFAESAFSATLMMLRQDSLTFVLRFDMSSPGFMFAVARLVISNVGAASTKRSNVSSSRCVFVIFVILTCVLPVAVLIVDFVTSSIFLKFKFFATESAIKRTFGLDRYVVFFGMIGFSILGFGVFAHI